MTKQDGPLECTCSRDGQCNNCASKKSDYIRPTPSPNYILKLFRDSHKDAANMSFEDWYNKHFFNGKLGNYFNT